MVAKSYVLYVVYCYGKYEIYEMHDFRMINEYVSNRQILNGRHVCRSDRRGVSRNEDTPAMKDKNIPYRVCMLAPTN